MSVKIGERKKERKKKRDQWQRSKWIMTNRKEG